MVFWQTICNQFALVKRPPMKSPTGSPAQLMRSATEVQQFIHDHFRSHPDVICVIPVWELENPADTVLTVFDQDILVGCIRYHFVGHCDAKRIHTVDCFCVHLDWRGKGVGDYLLHEMHHMMKDDPYAIFLKEGKQLPIIPFYTGIYVYRTLGKSQDTDRVLDISTDLAYQLMEINHSFRPFFMIHTKTANQKWRIYREGIYHVLCCIQDTYQTLYGKKMGWITAWIESPGMTDTMRETASYQLSYMPYFDMIWMNQIHIINTQTWKKPLWEIDGPFYWYTYQWSPIQDVGKSYCFIH